MIIWMVKQAPSREPKFHKEEMLGGVGRSISELLIIFRRGWFFRMLVICVFVVEVQR